VTLVADLSSDSAIEQSREVSSLQEHRWRRPRGRSAAGIGAAPRGGTAADERPRKGGNMEERGHRGLQRGRGRRRLVGMVVHRDRGSRERRRR
jgi:hypothetical protein